LRNVSRECAGAVVEYDAGMIFGAPRDETSANGGVT
jgi:hypothetical protein